MNQTFNPYSNDGGTGNFVFFLNHFPKYVFELIPTARQAYMTRHITVFLFLKLNMTIFKVFFFPAVVIEWNKLDSNIRSFESLALFILAFLRPFKKSTFQCHNPKGLKLISKLQLGLSHLRFHEFKHSFQDILNPICDCGAVETTVHYLLHCPNFSNERLIFFNKLQSTDANILSKDDPNISKVLYSDHSFNDEKNTSFLTASFEYIISTKRFKIDTSTCLCAFYLLLLSKICLLIYFIQFCIFYSYDCCLQIVL